MLGGVAFAEVTPSLHVRVADHAEGLLPDELDAAAADFDRILVEEAADGPSAAPAAAPPSGSRRRGRLAPLALGAASVGADAPPAEATPSDPCAVLPWPGAGADGARGGDASWTLEGIVLG